MRMVYSPALSATSEMTDEELDMYLASCVPLSNLPTPPPAKEQAMPRSVPRESFSQTPSLASFTTSTTPQGAYATHLANLVPLNVSAHRPHVLAIAGFLERADLAEEVVAFAACILDALSSRFAAGWRDALAPSEVQNCGDADSPRQQVQVSPDVIVLAALSLAHGWLVDRVRTSRHWSVREMSVQEIEATKRAILQDMEYGLFRISDETVQRRVTDMQRATRTAEAKASRCRKLSLRLAGTALWCHGVPTPEPSP